MSASTADLSRTLEVVKGLAVRVGVRDAESWFVGTRGGSFLYLCAADDTSIGGRVLGLGPTKSERVARARGEAGGHHPTRQQGSGSIWHQIRIVRQKTGRTWSWSLLENKGQLLTWRFRCTVRPLPVAGQISSVIRARVKASLPYGPIAATEGGRAS
jgi:hypothetical protein